DLEADYYLLHNRDIPNRVDDTVVKLHGKNTFFIRKSRGDVPDPIPIPYQTRIVSVGAGENITGAVSNHNRVYATPYIGDSQYHHTVEFLKQSLIHLITLTMETPEIDAVALDLHPGYGTRSLAQQFARDYRVPLIQIQHHWAHAASLLLDNNIDESVILTLDGLGYGTDGTYWGGEILHTTYEGYKRVGHLEPIPLLGGDKATRDPRRLVYALFQPYGKEKYFTGTNADVLKKMIPKAPRSSSLGRILDALSCYLDICTTMTYDGEPAMKLEKYPARGVPKHLFHITQKNGVINTSELFQQLDTFTHFPLMLKEKADLAVSFVKTLIEAMTDLAIQTAEKHGLNTIGVTGGVSYNIPIVKMIENHAKIYDMRLLIHHRIPNGDGGISIGQNVIAGHALTNLTKQENETLIKRQVF
ncbi:MAG: carbamoyltransferase HypF, partial [Methanobacteriota archaeon]